MTFDGGTAPTLLNLSVASSAGDYSFPSASRTETPATWDSDGDPNNPQNWSETKKWLNVGMISIMAAVPPLAAAIPAASIPQFLLEFESSDFKMGNFAVSIFLLGFAIGPLLISPLSEVYGRVIVYHTCNVLFVIFSVACALSTSLPMLTGFRFLAGCAGSCPVTIGNGSIGDIILPEKRGTALSIYACGAMVGPAVGPVAGAFLTQRLNWRWSLWLPAILGATISIAGFIILRESFAPTILGCRNRGSRRITNYRALLPISRPAAKPAISIVRAMQRPLKLLVLSPLMLLFALLTGLANGLVFILYTNIPFVFEDQYGFSIGESGLAYLGVGSGSFIGLTILIFVGDRLVICLTKNGVKKPEYRLPPLLAVYPLLPIGFLLFCWTAQYHVHWIVPAISTCLIGIGVIAVYIPVQVYLVDCYPVYAASSIAAVALLRSLLGSLLPLAGNSLFSNIGLGVGNSILAVVALLFWAVAFATYLYGERLRRIFPVDP